jgi:hypothetical protein
MTKNRKNFKKPEPTTKLTKKDLFYDNWMLEFPKEDIHIANDYLNRMLTFAIGLFSVVVAFKSNINEIFYPYIMASLIVGVIVSFYGNIPIEMRFNPNITVTIENAIKGIIKKKKTYIILSFSCIFISMCLILISVIFK